MVSLLGVRVLPRVTIALWGHVECARHCWVDRLPGNLLQLHVGNFGSVHLEQSPMITKIPADLGELPASGLTKEWS